MNTNKPYSESCDQNRDVILETIQPLFTHKKSVLEIGSGTGQHAVYFAKAMPHLIWQSSDQIEYHLGINQWLTDASLDNAPPPLTLNVSTDNWPKRSFDAIFSANAVHIMSWDNVVDFMLHALKIINPDGLLILYGPFNYNGKFTSDSNARFDTWLKNRDPKSGIRDFEAINKLAEAGGLKLESDFPMPANNRILCWKKT